MLTFNCVGRITPVKETEKLKQKEVKVFPSGWAQKTLNFNVSFGNSRVLMQIRQGYFADSNGAMDVNKNTIYTSAFNKDKEVEQIKVPMSDRFDTAIVASVPFGKKYSLDMNSINSFLIGNIQKKFQSGSSVKEEDMEKYNIHNSEECEQLIASMKANRKDYIYVGDFLKAVEKILADENIGKYKFKISGEYEYRYSEQKAQFYKTFVPKKIYRVTSDQLDSIEEKMEVNFDFYFNKKGFSDEDYANTGKCEMKGYIRYYDSQYKNDKCKGNVYAPMIVVLKSEDQRYIDAMKRKFTSFDGCDYKRMRLTCNYIDGAEKKEIQLEDLGEDLRSDIECGLISFEDVKKQLGGNVYGDRITEMRYVSYDVSIGAENTELTDLDVCYPEHDHVEEDDDLSIDVSSAEENEEDIFEI
jgi:translation initiation factor 1 (eIF-1/SUI1)